MLLAFPGHAHMFLVRSDRDICQKWLYNAMIHNIDTTVLPAKSAGTSCFVYKVIRDLYM